MVLDETQDLFSFGHDRKILCFALPLCLRKGGKVNGTLL